MPTREELRRALDVVLKMDDYGAFLRDEREAIQLLRDCVPVPREELDRLERAVWLEMVIGCKYPDGCEYTAFMHALEFQATDDPRECHWTPAAHEFAERMKGK